MRAARAPGDAVRPVDAQAVADLAAEQFVAWHAERLGLDVEQRVLDRAERLADDAAGAGPGDAAQILADVLVVHRRLADQAMGELFDDRGDARRAEILVELAPADDAVLGCDFQEEVIAP